MSRKSGRFKGGWDGWDAWDGVWRRMDGQRALCLHL